MPPFTVIGGYLGAGKTTLLNNLLSQAGGLKIAVLVNDFGEVNIDEELIASHDGGTISLTNGCVCCDLSNGFAVAINEVLKRADALDHIIVEASGVAEPGKIAHYGQMYDLSLDGVVVVVDAEQILSQAANKYVGDTVHRQLAQADLVVLNKTDLVPADIIPERRSWLTRQAPTTAIYQTCCGAVPVEVLLGLSSHALQSTDGVQNRGSDDRTHLHAHADSYRTWTLKRERPLKRGALERLANRPGNEVFRGKGFVYFSDDPKRRYLYQQVGRRWTLNECAETQSDFDGRTRIVFIGPKEL